MACVGVVCAAKEVRADYDPPLIPEPVAAGPTGSSSGSSVSADTTLYPLVAPSYHSDAGAPASLYLDFVGDTDNGNWGGDTPAYDADGDPTTFSGTELSNIGEIFQRVAEAYSPFNIDVTTQQPSNLSHGHTAEIIIGGDGSWYKVAGGVSYVGSFASTSADPNVSYVFSDNLSMSHHGVPKYVAEAIAHEAGHQFGLYHQSDWSNGALVNEYSYGTYVFHQDLADAKIPQLEEPGSKSPIMGNSYYADRGLWWSGTSDTNGVQRNQDDMSVIASVTNGFGYRPEPSNVSFATAAPLTIDNTGFFNAQGIIIHPTDRDYFSFQSPGGLVSFLVNVAPFGAMLDASAQIYKPDGTLMAQSATSSLSELISANLPGGTYDLVVSSAGNYGDVGQYFVTGELGALVPEPGMGCLVIGSWVFLSRKRPRR
jgi:Metallo-peptidase family M12B Reprolysin-like